MLIKQSLEQKEVVLKMEEFEQYLLDYGVNNNFNGSEFALDLRNKNVRNMVDFIKNKRLPNLEKLWISTNKENGDITNKFLEKNLPNTMDKLYFYSNDGVKFQSDLSLYLDRLLPSIKKVKECFFIDYFYLSKEYLRKIFKAGAHLDTIVIYRCLIDSEMYDFEEMDYSIKNLYLYSIGCASLANWKVNPKRFEGLIKGLSKTDIRKSLEHMSIWNWDYEITEAKNILELYGMGHVTITTDKYTF